MARPTLAESAQRKFDQAEIELRTKAAKYSTQAIDEIYAVMKSEKTSDSPKLRACEMLLKAYNDLRLEDRKLEAESGGGDGDNDEGKDDATLEIGGKIISL